MMCIGAIKINFLSKDIFATDVMCMLRVGDRLHIVFLKGSALASGTAKQLYVV